MCVREGGDGVQFGRVLRGGVIQGGSGALQGGSGLGGRGRRGVWLGLLWGGGYDGGVGVG